MRQGKAPTEEMSNEPIPTQKINIVSVVPSILKGDELKVSC